jgi:hypothetical protein
LQQRFHPGFENLWYPVLAGVQWLFTTSFQGTFRAREFLLEEMEGKKGTELTLVIRDATTLTGATLYGLVLLRVAAVVFSLTLALFLVTIDTFAVRIDTATAVVAIGSFFFLPLVAALTSQYAFEHDVACEGFPIDEELRSRKLRIAFLIVLIPLVLSPFACGEKPPLPHELIDRFLAWLSSLFQFEPTPFELKPEADPGMMQLIEELERLREEEPAPSLIDMTRLLAILKRLFFIALPLVVIGFILAPLLSKNFRAAVRNRSLLRFLFRKMKEIAGLFRFARHKKEARVLVGPDDLAPVREALAELARGRKTRQKRREVGRMTRRFLQLIAWGTTRTVPYSLSTAPGEYVRALIHLDTLLAVDFLTAGDAFEEALYSDHLLDAERLADYEGAIKRIITPKRSP